jgi:fructose-1,6-bisphosphatase/sedoheptulose 1,7-bisphosphatase-like protein
MNKILNTIKQKSKTIDIIATLQSDISTLSNAVNELKLLQGRQMAIANRSRHSEIIENINEAEFKVYSQWGDDGIIQFLVDYLQIKNKTFIWLKELN